MTAARLTVDTNEGNGTLYVVVTRSSTSPNAFQVEGGADENGDDAEWSGSLAVTDVGTLVIDTEESPGLEAGVTYYAHFMQKDAAGNRSAVVTSAGFTLTDLWLPSELATLELWLKGDELSGSDGANIASWPDASGNSRNATQSTEADKPNLEVAELNGLNVVRFMNSNSEWLNLPNFLTGFSAGTIFLVIKSAFEPNTNSAGAIKMGSSASADHWTNADNNWYSDFGSTVRKNIGNPATTLAQWNIIMLRSASADWKAFINGTQVFTTSSNTVGWSTTPFLGSGHPTNVQTFDGWIAEVVLLSEAVGTDDRQKVEGYLAHKWGLTALLDAGHPYKSSPP